MIYNGFTQKKIKTEYLLRPKNPKEFLHNIGISYTKINTNMTNGGILEFNNNLEKKKNIKKLSNFNIFGFKFFEIKEISLNKVFFRIQVKSFSKISQYSSSKFIKKNLSYDSKSNIKLLKKFNQNKELFNEFKFLKTTGKHFFKGQLLSKRMFSKKNVIDIRKFVSFIRDYFNL